MRLARLVCMAAITAALGCGDRQQAVETAMLETDETAGTAMLRVVHADPGAGQVSVYRNGTEAAGGLRYLDVTPWLPVTAGDEGLELVPTSDARGIAVAEIGEQLEEGGRYTLVAYGSGDDPELRLFEEPGDPDPDRAWLRVVNLIPDGPEVELFIRGGRDRLLDDVEPGEVEEEWVEPTSRALEFRREGERAPYAIVPNVELEAGRSYMLVLTGTGERPDVVRVDGDEDGLR